MEDPVVKSPLRRFRDAHEHEILRVLREYGPRTRHELHEETGLSRTTLYAIINDLVDAGAIVESASTEIRGRGRPVTTLSLDTSASKVVGVELGRGHISVAIANLAHQIIASSTQTLALSHTAREIADAAISTIEQALSSNRLSTGKLEKIVIGTPLFFGGESRYVEEIQTDIAAHIEHRFGTSPLFENNARLVALAEMHFGTARDVDDLLYVHLDEGVGGGIVLSRRIMDGPHGRAGEVGHISVDASGPDCWCGGKGCLERYLALPRLAETLKETVPALLADPLLLSRIGEHLDLLSRVIAGQLSALDLRVAVLGGALGQVDGVAARVITQVRAIVPAYIRDEVDIRVATLGALGSARGAIVLGLADGPP